MVYYYYYYYRMRGHAQPPCSMCSSMSNTPSMQSELPRLASSFSRSFSAAERQQAASSGGRRRAGAGVGAWLERRCEVVALPVRGAVAGLQGPGGEGQEAVGQLQQT